MNVIRGDIVTADYPNSSGAGSKVRPVLVIQNDYYNTRIANVLIANITTNLKNSNDKAHFLIEVSRPDGVRSGLRKDSLVSCINLATIRIDRIKNKIGELPDQAMQEIEKCLKVALGIS